MEQARLRAALARIPHDPGADGSAHRQGPRHRGQLPAPAAAACLGAVQVESSELSFGHARTLLAFEHAEEIEKAAQRVVALSLSVRQTENYVQGLLHPERNPKKEPKPEPAVDPNVREVQERLQRSLGLKVAIEDHHGRAESLSNTRNSRISTLCWSTWLASEPHPRWTLPQNLII